MLDPTDRRKRGLEVYKKLGLGENEGAKKIDEDLWQFITDIGFGEIWSRPGLSLRDRELIVMSALMAIGSDGISFHFRKAHNVGITFEEIKELILQLTIYLGMPKGLFAMRKLKAVMAEPKSDA
jgi:4-carboxymuconolactone decarboxylase